MKQKLCRRLEELETISAAAASRTNSRASADEAIEKVRALLRANNVQQEPNESLVETFARFLGITSRELRDRLISGPMAVNPPASEDFDEWRAAGAKFRSSRISFASGTPTFTDSASRWRIGRRSCGC